ncbi:MAG: C39 family peptidase [Coriobacteriia bacterium]|nr:C39 family peptidase [Coriobacteriia bacterium]
MSQTGAVQEPSKQNTRAGQQAFSNQSPSIPAKSRRRWPLVLLLSVLFLVVVGGLGAATLYRENSVDSVYHYAGYGFHLVAGKDPSQLEATLISNDTTAPVASQVRAVYRTGNLWTDLRAWLANDAQTYPVTRVTGLSSKGGPLDLSELATDTAIVLEGQSICYQTPGYRLEATQAGGALQVQTAAMQGTATLPAHLFTDGSGAPLKLELSAEFESKLLAAVSEVADTPTQRASDCDALAQRIDQTVAPYKLVMSRTLVASVQSEQKLLQDKQDNFYDREGVLLDVPVISQRPVFKAGCEAASTAMLLTYAGHPMSTANVIAVMPYSGNPAKGYVGNPRTWDGYTIYPSAMKTVVQKYLGTGVDLTGCTMDTIHAYLREGKPVVCWLGPGALPGISPHCVCVTGYKNGTLYYNDPYLNTKNRPVSEKTFAGWRAEFGNRAMSY